LFEVSAPDRVALALARVLVALVGIQVALIPASRAAGIDPMTVLRDEGLIGMRARPCNRSFGYKLSEEALGQRGVHKVISG
jgi:hypothetical protein